ncbi:hypothetical protein CN900_19605 [Bacillus anthracis]|nr:hypothetical protein CN385_27525 [Bacillus anthracis]PGH90114.1 hypothetical protein CN900_19605 [Bacillus anthracis]
MNDVKQKMCKVCETPYLLKFQVGYVSKNHFSFECPTCGVMLEGIINVDNKEAKFDWNFDNLVDYSGDILKSKEGYFMQLTSEFYENKISSLKDYTFGTPPPFIRNLCDDIKEMIGLASYLAEDINQHVNHYRNLINLVLSNKDNVKYVFSEFEKLTNASNMMDEKKFINVYKTDRYNILFMAITDSIRPLLELNAEKFQVNDIRENLYKMYENKVEFQKFKNSFQESLPNFINLLTNAVYSSIKIIPEIIPTIVSETYNHKDIKVIKEQYGLNTANYKTLLQNYAENYEILGKIMPLIAAIDNINTRKDINNFVKDSNTRKNDPFVRATTSLKDFSKATVGIKIRYLKKISSDVPRYNDLTVLNNRIRNAINHSSVDYDSIEQKLTFKDGSIITERYLIEFAEENYVILYLQLYCLFIVCSLATKFSKEDNA